MPINLRAIGQASSPGYVLTQNPAAAWGQDWEVAGTGGPPSGSAGGDLAATYPNPSVARINGIAVATGPTSGQVLTATSPTAANWQTPTSAGGPPTGAASGDLSGSYPGPTVTKVNGIAVSGTPSSGFVLVATGTTTAGWQTPPAAPPNGSAGGDLTSSYPNPVVARINGTTVPSTPGTGQVLTATSSSTATWQSPVAYSPVETVNTVATSGAAQTIPDVTTATISDITLTAAPCVLTFPTAAAGKSFLLVARQDGTGSRTITWPGTVKWPAGTAPTLTTTAAKADVFSFVCTDGTNWLGFTDGQNY